MDVPVFIVTRDRVTDLRNLVEWLERAGHERITFVDNDSAWPPLLEYLEQTPHDVVRLGENVGCRAVWSCGLVPVDEPFVVTDPDVLPVEDCPLNAVEYLGELMARHKVPKVGLGLMLDDVPADMPSLAWERGPAINGAPLGDGARHSLIDTTFALHAPGTLFQFEAIRTGRPYLARHLPWYRREIDDEHRFYLERAHHGPQGTSWEPSL